MFVWNVYRPLVRPSAGHAEIRLMVRLAIFVAGGGGRRPGAGHHQYLFALGPVLGPGLRRALSAVGLRPVRALDKRAGGDGGSLRRPGPADCGRRACAWNSRFDSFPGSGTHGFYAFPYRTAAMLARLAHAARRLAFDANRFSPAQPGLTIHREQSSRIRSFRMIDPAFPVYSRGQKLLAYAVHLYTAMGLLCGALIAADIVQQNYRRAFLWMIVAVLIDATDGTFARKFRVKEVVPHIDGRKLDDIVDYVNYTFLPLLMIGSRRLAPLAQLAVGHGAAGRQCLRICAHGSERRIQRLLSRLPLLLECLRVLHGSLVLSGVRPRNRAGDRTGLERAECAAAAVRLSEPGAAVAETVRRRRGRLAGNHRCHLVVLPATADPGVLAVDLRGVPGVLRHRVAVSRLAAARRLTPTHCNQGKKPRSRSSWILSGALLQTRSAA